MLDLKGEIEQLRHAVWAHATVDQAIGVVIALGHLSPGDAWEVIRAVSMRTNTKLRDVSQQIVTWGLTGVLADELRSELEHQLGWRPQSGTRPAEGE